MDQEQTDKKAREDVCPGHKKKLGKAEFEAAREKLSQAEGPVYWRSLEELAGNPEFLEQLHREFPKGASEWLDAVSRRGFLQLMGASLALAGMTACTKLPTEAIVPYVKQPEEIIPGKPLFFATAFTLGGYAQPLLVESNMGRPTKVEGNPEHPASLGATDVFAQASLLDLYDPDRAENNYYNGEARSWSGFLAAVRGPLVAQQVGQGGGLRFLTQTVSSPTLASQLNRLLQKYPGAKWHQWEPVNRDQARAGAMAAFGQDVDTRYNFQDADVILSLDADFLYGGFPGSVRYVRDYASRRRPDGNKRPFASVNGTLIPARPMNRMYMLESTPTPTGAKADHKFSMRAAEVAQYSRWIASRLGINAGGGAPPPNGYPSRFIDALARDLQAHRGASLVIVGEHQPPEVHALAHAMNAALGNVGKTVNYSDPVPAKSEDCLQSLRELVADMNAGKVDLLVIMSGNPVYDAPADLDFAGAMAKVRTVIYHGTHINETAANCQWFLMGTHYLEAWSDARAYDGTVSIVQPLIAPLYGGRSEHELLAAFGNEPDVSGYDVVRDYWRSQHPGGDFEAFWRKSVHDGFITGSALPPRNVTARNSVAAAPEPVANGIELIFRRDPSIYDGRFSNNGWLQEMPKPLSKLTWDNPALIGPEMAKNLGLQPLDLVEIELQGRKIRAAIWVQAGHPDNAVTLSLGYGRTAAGRVGTGMGFDCFPLRTSNALWLTNGVRLRKTGEKYPLASTQGWQWMEGRRQVRVATLDEFQKDPAFAQQEVEAPPPSLTLFPGYGYKNPDFNKLENIWGMAIDLNACVGCNACVAACQSENNIAVVGKQEVSRGRYMHWLRVDTYYQGDPANPKAYFQPVPCQQCENAPCEVVCPVGATVHSTEGLNDMVYNRCVGTRYCSNNCPYKVRRFNFFLFQDWTTPQWKLMRNPDVSVRSRGVMEKCTYCVQRITHARITSEEQNRNIADNEVQTACMQACPADAIVFGNINDPKNRVAQLKQNTRNYGLLAELNTRPRTSYLADVRNPNPDLADETERS